MRRCDQTNITAFITTPLLPPKRQPKYLAPEYIYPIINIDVPTFSSPPNPFPAPYTRLYSLDVRPSFRSPSVLRIRKEGQGSWPPRGHRIPRCNSRRGAHTSIRAYFLQSVSSCIARHTQRLPVKVRLTHLFRRWWWGHAFFNFIISGPLVFAAWAMGQKAHNLTDAPMDHHKVHPLCF